MDWHTAKKRNIMANKIAVETLTLREISDLFKQSLEITFPRANGAIANKVKKLQSEKVSSHKWVQTYEVFKPSKFNFYCQRIPKQPQPIVSIGMIHRTTRGLILVAVDVSNGGIVHGITSSHWDKWVNIYTDHYCERYAERIMRAKTPTFTVGSEGIMFADTAGVARVKDTISDGVEEIEFQFKEGQAYGYRDVKNKLTYFRTVYSNDMLKGDRLEFREEWKLSIDQLNELFKWNL